MNARSRCHEKVPDGVGKRDQPVTLEEKDAHHVQDASQRQFTHACALYLEQSRSKEEAINEEHAAVRVGSAFVIHGHLRPRRFRHATVTSEGGLVS